MADPKLVVHRDPEILGGTPVFVGTRVPVKILFDYLEAGDSLEVLLDEFPSVAREQAAAAAHESAVLIGIRADGHCPIRSNSFCDPLRPTRSGNWRASNTRARLAKQ